MGLTTTELRHKLEELIAALARRLPHHERAGEAAILGDAEKLRREALRRLAVLDDETPRMPEVGLLDESSRP